MTEDNLYYRPDKEQLEKIRPYPINLSCDAEGVKVMSSKDKIDINSLVDMYSQTTGRYIEAEKFILRIAEMNCLKRVFMLPNLCWEFLRTQIKKYDF